MKRHCIVGVVHENLLVASVILRPRSHSGVVHREPQSNVIYLNRVVFIGKILN